MRHCYKIYHTCEKLIRENQTVLLFHIVLIYVQCWTSRLLYILYHTKNTAYTRGACGLDLGCTHTLGMLRQRAGVCLLRPRTSLWSGLAGLVYTSERGRMPPTGVHLHPHFTCFIFKHLPKRYLFIVLICICLSITDPT